MNRRSFLGTLGLGVVSSAAAVALDVRTTNAAELPRRATPRSKRYGSPRQESCTCAFHRGLAVSEDDGSAPV